MRAIPILPALTITCALSVVSIPVFASEERTLTAAAQEFIAKGAEPTLRMCSLPKPRCGDAKLIGRVDIPGESNDEKRIARSLTFAGLELALTIPVMSPRRYLVGKVEISTSNWPVQRGLRVGQSQAKVLEALGVPTTENGNCIEYLNGELESSVAFCFSNGRITQIVWDRWID
jgi:hypothetical protein